MKCISVQHPWAWAIFHSKDIENRTWKTDYRGDLLIHAGKKFDFAGMKWIMKNFPKLIPENYFFPSGCIIGKVTVSDCVRQSSSPWFFGPYGFVLSDPVIFEKPIPYRGQLKLFEVSEELIKQAV